mmetsp:Transcript_61212/g.114484  ORF Transcript_61212/g.114484 Transcript_61212/m.114484 type:complete len:441 (-) Transcript_61212:36-1358(-)
MLGWLCVLLVSCAALEAPRHLVFEVTSDGSVASRAPARLRREDASARVKAPGHVAEEKAWHELEDVDSQDLPLMDGREHPWGEATRLKPQPFDWELPSEKWTSALSSPDLEGQDWGSVQDEAEERRAAERMVRNVDNSFLATLVRVGEGVGPITYSRSPGAHQRLNRELRQRLVAQDAAAIFFLLFVLGVAIWVSCLGVYQFADDPSQVVFYSDPKHTHHRMLCSSADQESFLEAFNTPPHKATLRLIGRRTPRPATRWFTSQGGLYGITRRFLPGRRRPVIDANVLFDVSLDLSSFVSGEGRLASGEEAAKLEAHLGSQNPLQILVLRKRVLWANWEDMATNVKQKLRALGFDGDVEVRFDSQEDMRVYRNTRWQNFVRTPITHMLSVLSGIGLLLWLPYLYWRSDVVVVESNFHIQLDVQRYWEMLSAGLDVDEGFRA